MKVRFWMSDKVRERMLAEAFLRGVKLHGDEVEMRSLGEPFTADCDVAVMAGVKSKELWQAHTRAGIQLLYTDKGYTRDSREDDVRGWKYWRVAVNGHHPTSKFRPDYPGDRLAEMGWTFKPWRESGKHIVIAGSSEKYHNFYDIKEPTDWTMKLVKSMKHTTDREILYRPKKSWKNAVPIEGTTWAKDGDINDHLRYAHCLITHGSNACFEAMLMGVPSIIIGDAVAKPISSRDISEIERPRLASDEERTALLRFLAYQQFTLEEMYDGKAWPTIRRQFFE